MINFKKFFNLYRGQFGKITVSQVTPMEKFFSLLLIDPQLSLTQKAYVAATVYHETAYTFKPLREYGRGGNKVYAKVDRVTGHKYYGRGFVQLTWADNYKTMGKKLGVDLYRNPDLALDFDIAYKVLIRGMMDGDFNGKGHGLAYYVNDTRVNYKEARRTVNIMDRATLIEGYARKFEFILRSMGEIKVPTTDEIKATEITKPLEKIKRAEEEVLTPVDNTSDKVKESSFVRKIIDILIKLYRLIRKPNVVD